MVIIHEQLHRRGSHDLTEESDIKASIAALNFIISSAAKYNVDSESLSHELQQLGLPKGDLHYSMVLSSSYSI